MKAETYSALLKDLQKLQKVIVASQIAAVRGDPALMKTLERLHTEAEVGGRLDDFVATAARKSTVLLLLRTVFVRVLEDLGILGVKRIRDEWGFAAFREVAPALGIRAYLAFVFRDLAVDFPALFASGEDELALPDEDCCRTLWNLWHHPNKHGELYSWNGDGFESHFLGELYQALDADIRKRYALLQTPPFVERYILDHTLTPALAEFDPEVLRAKGERFRLLDPTCGSGHFLIGAFHRLADYWRDRHGLSEWAASERALESVWGCDINPHAVDIADFRLLLEVVARTGVKDLERLAELKLNLRAMDSLIPWERAATQGELFPAKDRLDAYATPKQRRDNAAFLGRAFHVVVGNPPYITPKDVRKRDDYRMFWPDVCHMEYVLSVPFVQRWFDLAEDAKGYVGQITSNSFGSRGYGKKLLNIEAHRWNITHIVDTSGVPIPGHGVPTVVLFGTGASPTAESLIVVACLRGETRRAGPVEYGPVWRAIVEGTRGTPTPGIVEVSAREREAVLRWPMVLAGDIASEARARMSASSQRTLGDLALLGTGINTGENQAFELKVGELPQVPRAMTLEVFVGEDLRDWGGRPSARIPWAIGQVLERSSPVFRAMWPRRTILDARKLFSVPCGERGIPFWRVREYYEEKYTAPFHVVHPLLATHPHFAVELSDSRELHSAPLVVPKEGTRESALAIAALMNSSAVTFWLKGVLRDKGNGGIGGGIAAEPWERFYEFDAAKLAMAPFTQQGAGARLELASALDDAARLRTACMPGVHLATMKWSPAGLTADLALLRERYLEVTRRMVSLQEELDWSTYGCYGLVKGVAIVDPAAIEPLAPGHRPFEIALARREAAADDDEKSAWWSRHGHERATDVPDSYSVEHRARLQQRIDHIESDSHLALLETPPYKRRWQLPDWAAETKDAAESWLLDRLEDLFRPATDTAPHGPLAEPKPYRLEDIAAAWSRDPRVTAVAGMWAGTGPSVDLTLVAEKLLRENAFPDNPYRIYSDEGVRKLDEWKDVWNLQDQEDTWEKAAADAMVRGDSPPKKKLADPRDPTKEIDNIPLPRKFDEHDFAKADYFATRGKLNVPRERFILFADLTPNRFGWNGWRDRERALTQVEAFTLAENDPQQPLPVPTTDDPRRCGATYGLWESLPDVRRWSAPADHAELQTFAREACRQQRCPCPIVEAWKAKVLNPKATDAPNGKGKSAKKKRAPHETNERTEEPTVSVAARAWVASLFQLGTDADAASVWARHRSRLSEPAQGTLPGVSAGPVQLTIVQAMGGPPAELVSLDQAQLAAILDDLVASGDLQVKGRGSKKRFQLVPRRSSTW